MLPAAALINVVQGSPPVAETCLVKSIEAVWLLTTREAVAVFPFPPSFEVTAVVVLFFVPAVVPVTGTGNVQLLFGARDPPVNAMVLGAVVVSEPPHVAVGPLLVTVKPPTRESLKSTPLNAVPGFGLLIVNVRVEVFPVKIELGEKDLPRVGGAITVRESVA